MHNEIHNSPDYTQILASNFVQQQNNQILSEFLNRYNDPDIRKTHLFEGRYENIYLDESHIPALAGVIQEATEHASRILQQTKLRAGYWFNFMPPGSVTIPHRHDDDDELLSGVYYISVPENSGNLRLQVKNRTADHSSIEITPQAGLFVFFKPDVVHEVTRNNSEQNRLSIGMNFGVPD